MRLKHIKLVGFKSFVDPTKVPFPHQMTCVVGPNGCGKSNVIDAVRWVLGESSAKNLRGDAMTDVIFNGSNARKPVSQASVELVFDNTSGRIQGEYANYAEISVKRLVTRDGRSDYFLNGSKCRRRDITDLFLGTGLGPRSYAIIEQGMISRLIESKPQELRVFLEEAAGISKYKERRRETENRMQHTRDNLDRLNDVRDELGSQLDKLQRQAAAARRYKDLKAQERKYKAELQALRWLAQEQQAESIRAKIREQETELERWLAEQRGSERGTTELREQAEESKQKLDAVQQQYYQLGNDVTRTEHQLQTQRQQLQQREQRRAQLQAELSQLQQTLADDQLQREELETTVVELQPQHEAAEQSVAAASERFEQDESAWLKWQDDYQQHLDALQRRREQQQQLQLQQQRLEHQQQRLSDELTRAKTTIDELQREQQQLDSGDLQADIAKLTEQAELHQQEALQAQSQQQQLQAELEQLFVERDQQKSTQQQLLGRQSSLEHLLKAAQAQDWPVAVQQWLQQHNIKPLGQVRDLLQADANWQFAVEQVVAPWLDAWVVEKLPAQWPQQLGARLITLSPGNVKATSLASKVTGPLARWALLQGMTCVENADSATSADSWITATGQWFYGDSFQVANFTAADSQLAQQQELADVIEALQHGEQRLATMEQQRQQLQQQLEQVQHQFSQAQDTLREVQAQLASRQEKLQWQQQQAQALVHKQQQLSEQCEQWQQEQETLALTQQEIEQQLLQLSEQQPTGDDDSWQAKRSELQLARQQSRDALTTAQHHLQQLTMQLQQAQTQLQHHQTLINRVAQQQQQLHEQLQQLNEPDVEGQEQLELLAMQLEELLQTRELVDEERRNWANALSEQEAKIREISQGAQGVHGQVEKVRAQLQSSQMELAALQERTRNVLAVLQEMNQPLKPVLEQLPETADEKAWQTELERLQNAIQRLGAINLAAIEEAETLAERKQYLDQQNDDLSAALETLETAIRKIDKETRHRFRTTYDAVNSGLQELFPKVFGGGSAYLELTDDDLLETGVSIMARPPGKKNSTIHLLSGGEKALTALSLVFAIFRLNPAPFCLLDEVDAPLDDANVGRFCRLVEEMSTTVQFIYISHNKVAMEMASHLAGVTMQEAGVSRLVAVDIDEAVALTEAS